MDARLQQICAMVAAKPRSIDDIVLSLKTTKAMGSALVGRLAAVGVVKRDGAVVTAIDPEQAVAIANGTGDMPKRKRKKRKPNTDEAAPTTNGHDFEPTVIFAKDEDGDLNICRRDGEGSTIVVPSNELRRLVAYVKANFKRLRG